MNTSTTNKGQIFIIVATIAVLAAACVLTNCWLAYVGKESTQAFTLLTGGLVGSLTSMLVKTTPTEISPAPKSPSPAPVEVVNDATDPVPTTETKEDK